MVNFVAPKAINQYFCGDEVVRGPLRVASRHLTVQVYGSSCSVPRFLLLCKVEASQFKEQGLAASLTAFDGLGFTE